jgi:hypothetical protein
VVAVRRVERPILSGLVADLPIALEGDLATLLTGSLDVEGKILRALDALGPIAGRDVVFLGDADGLRASQLTAAGSRLVCVDDLAAVPALGESKADALIGWWSGFRGVTDDDLRVADTLLRPGGRILVVHDYGRDDVSRLRGDQPEYGLWSKRNGPFLRSGFRIRVLHCWWTFDSIERAQAFLGQVFGEAGTDLAAALKRPRLSYNVAVYHRTRGETEASMAAERVATPA